MNEQQKETICKMREAGFGYTKIAHALTLPANTIKSFCKRNNLGGVAVKSEKLRLASNRFCLQCGKFLPQNTGHKPRKFCCDACRITWWNTHPDAVNQRAIYTQKCAFCEKTFASYGNKNRRYCCHACYIADRFGKNGAAS